MTDNQWGIYLHDRFHRGKISTEELEIYKNTEVPVYKYDNHSSMVKPVPIPFLCLKAFHRLFETNIPPIVVVRTSMFSVILYGIAEASGGGFSSTISDGNELRYRVANWGSDKENHSPNWREFANLVEALEFEAGEGKLSGTTIVLATYNSTVESCFYTGNSASEILFDLIIRIRTI